MKLTAAQQTQIIDLLWDNMKRDPEHKDRRQTGWGTKTKEGLCACIDRIILDPVTCSVCGGIIIKNVCSTGCERR